MTTTILTDLSTTITSTILATQTAVVKGILDLTIQTHGYESGSDGIVFGKQANPETTISTITSSSSTTSSPTNSIVSSTTSSAIHFGNSLFQQNSSTSGNNSKIGLAIGIPVAIIGSVLFIVSLYFYLRYRKSKALNKDAKLQNFYDDKYNYRISALNETNSPYNVKTTYQYKPQQASSSIPSYHQYDVQSSTIVPTIYSNVPSIKQIPQGQDNSTKWQTPIHKWFNSSNNKPREGNTTAMSSRASLSTGIFSPKTPAMALREFKLKKQQQKQSVHNDHGDQIEYNEKSPILPSFPEKTYGNADSSFQSISHSSNSSDGSIKTQVVQGGGTKKHEIILQNPTELGKNKKKFAKNKDLNYKNTTKPLPKVPNTAPQSAASMKSLAGLEKIVMERMIPTTPKVDFAKYKNDKVYMVVKNYQRNLADELSVSIGEYVKILARHTDGWCLVEKCNLNGEVLYQDTNNYINEGRGVMPELCLQKE